MNVKLNVTLLLAAVIALSSTTYTYAQQADNVSLPAVKARAEVIAELKQAEADGSAASTRFPDATSRLITAQPESVVAGPKTRAEVLYELQQARAHGTDAPTGFTAFHTPATAAPDVVPTRTANQK
jgi:hypothetical protein